jgi:hypothetical protein
MAACGLRESLTFPDLDRRLGVEPLCAALYREGASGPVRIPPVFEFTFPSLKRLLLGRKDEPFSEVSPKEVFDVLPKDLGAIQGCRPGGFKMDGRQITKEVVLGYPRYDLTVTLRYMLADSPKLRFFRVEMPEPKAAQAAPAAPAAAPAPPLDQELVRIHLGWLVLDALLAAAVKSGDAGNWTAVEADAAAMSRQAESLRRRLAKDRGRPPVAVHASYARALGDCAMRARRIAEGMRRRDRDPAAYPGWELSDDRDMYRRCRSELDRLGAQLRR